MRCHHGVDADRSVPFGIVRKKGVLASPERRV